MAPLPKILGFSEYDLAHKMNIILPLGTCKSQYLDYDIVCDISVGGELCLFENCDAIFIVNRVRVKMNLSVG